MSRKLFRKLISNLEKKSIIAFEFETIKNICFVVEILFGPIVQNKHCLCSEHGNIIPNFTSFRGTFQ